MEILNSYVKKRTVLLISDGMNDLSGLKTILEEEYKVAFFFNSTRDFATVKESAGVISAAIICATDAAAENFALFDWIKKDSIIAAVPMLIYCGNESDEKYVGECLRRGAVDVIAPPLMKEVVLNRLENSIRLKDSATFLEIERMLRELPSNIYLKDEKGRYIFATHYWHHLDHHNDPDWTIRGKTDIDIRKDKENAVKAMESDLELMRTGKGTSYIIEINEDGVQEFLEIIKRPVRDSEGNITGIIALINDVTEMELLRISLEEKAMKDELTGAGNRRSFEKYATEMIGGVELPVSFISADCNDLKSINDTYGHFVGDEYIRMSVLLFRMILPESCHIFRTGGDEFVMVLPSVSAEEAEEYVRRLKEEEKHYRLKSGHISVSYGVSCLDSVGKTVRDCIDDADKKMYVEKKEHKKRMGK